MLLPTVFKLKRDKAVLESNVDYEDEEEIEVGFTTTIQPIKSVKRTKNASKKLDSIPTCQIQIAETLPVSVFDDKDLAPNHLPMHEVCNKTNSSDVFTNLEIRIYDFLTNIYHYILLYQLANCLYQ